VLPTFGNDPISEVSDTLIDYNIIQPALNRLSFIESRRLQCRVLIIGAIMKRRAFIGLIGAAASWPLTARAQHPAKIKRIAIANPSVKFADLETDPSTLVFFEELKRLGYAKGTNLIIDLYSAEGHTDRYGDLAREVVSTNPDLIVTAGTPLTLRFKAATNTIPVVTITGDPIRFGLISSIARPGGNITGVSVDAGLEIWGKRLELLAQALPKLTNTAFVSTQGGWNGAGGRGLRDTAQKLGISLTPATLGSTVNEAEYRFVFSSIQRDQVDGIMISDETENYPYRLLLVQLVEQIRLPAIYSNREQAEAGGLMSYSWDLKASTRRMAVQAAEILNGGNPAEMPYFQEARYELVINLKTAKTLGLEIPAGLVAAANAVIE
jgi:putative ABC transport system substrate-binding protein